MTAARRVARRAGPFVATPLAAAALALTACAAPVPHPATPAPAPSTPASTSTAPGSPAALTAAPPAQGGLAETDRLQREHRLAAVLPHETAHYRIDDTVGADGRLQLRVTLLAVLNGPAELASYQAQLRQYRAEALDFIQAQGDDPSTYAVTWLPADPLSTTTGKETP
jgi:hypothetical protein